MAELHCRDFDGVAAELALGVLVGRERGAALAHLESCPRCRRLVEDLSSTADRLLVLTPGADPVPGLEHRIMAGIGPRPAKRLVPVGRRYARAAVLAAAFLLGGLVLGNDAPPTSQPLRLVPAPHTGRSPIPAENIVLYAPLTEGNLQVGQAYLYDGAHDWMYLSLDNTQKGSPVAADAPDTNVTCTLVRPDGSTLPLGDRKSVV